MKPALAPIALLLLLSTPAFSSAVWKDVTFTHTADVGLGNEVCVIGPHPALGGDNPLRAIKLVWSQGNIWSGKIALPAGATITHRFVKRPFNVTQWILTTSDVNLTTNQTLQVPAHTPPPWNGKTIFAHLPVEQANIHYRDLTHGGAWATTPMQRVGPGRSPNENLFRVEGIAPSGAELEFVFNGPSNIWFNAPAPPSSPAQGSAPAVPEPYQNLGPNFNFRTKLDLAFVQDQQVYNYKPPASVVPPNDVARDIGSTVPTIPGRRIRILLPRGYSQNTWKKYPVAYFHDGQNVTFPGGDYGTWDADRIATYEIGQGRMRECILVSIPNGNGLGSDRRREYLPDGDTYGSFEGAASQYLQFLLGNVLPTLDYNFRTFPNDPANTIIAGSSMGGLVSDYIAHAAADRFGTAGVFSPAYALAPNFTASRPVASHPLRLFLSMGTNETSGGVPSQDFYWSGAITAYNAFLRNGHTAGRSLLFEGTPAGLHNEKAWSRLLPGFFAFALDPWLEANPLALAHFPPRLSLGPLAPNATTASLRYTSPFGIKNRLQTSTTLTSWTNLEETASALPWEEITTPASAPNDTQRFWRLQSQLP